MENLWAPWRIGYILENPAKNSCFLCDAIQDNQDEKHLILHRGAECFCILNKYPYNGGHLMVSPKRHTADISALSDSELLEIMKLTRNMKELLATMMNPEGFNIGINLGKSAGAGLVGHIHVHIVPRWNGDTNFMPVVSGVKVIPQSLDELYKEFRERINA